MLCLKYFRFIEMVWEINVNGDNFLGFFLFDFVEILFIVY